MLTETRKHFSTFHGRPRFAQVTVGRLDTQAKQGPAPRPEISLSGHAATEFTEQDLKLMEAARRGIHQVDLDFGWEGPQHSVVRIEGPLVDINADAAFLAAVEATKALIGL